jgi:hypothetical protein
VPDTLAWHGLPRSQVPPKAPDTICLALAAAKPGPRKGA